MTIFSYLHIYTWTSILSSQNYNNNCKNFPLSTAVSILQLQKISTTAP